MQYKSNKGGKQTGKHNRVRESPMSPEILVVDAVMKTYCIQIRDSRTQRRSNPDAFRNFTPIPWRTDRQGRDGVCDWSWHWISNHATRSALVKQYQRLFRGVRGYLQRQSAAADEFASGRHNVLTSASAAIFGRLR